MLGREHIHPFDVEIPDVSLWPVYLKIEKRVKFLSFLGLALLLPLFIMFSSSLQHHSIEQPMAGLLTLLH